MAFLDDIFTFIQTQAPITALVGENVHPVKLPQTPGLPAVVFQKISRPRIYSHDGDSGLGNARYQFSAWAETLASAEAIRQALIDSFSGFNGVMGDTSRANSFILNEQDDEEPETGLYRQMVDIEFWH